MKLFPFYPRILGLALSMTLVGCVDQADNRAALREIEGVGGIVDKSFSGPSPFSQASVYKIDFSQARLSDAQFKDLASALKQLSIRKLVLRDSKLSDASIATIEDTRKNLEYALIDVTNTGFTEEGIGRIRALLPYAKIVDTSAQNAFESSECQDLAFSHNGRRLVAVEYSSTAIYELESKAKLAMLPGGHMAVFSSDDKWLAIVGGSESSVWSLESFERTTSLTASRYAAFSDDSKNLYTSEFGEIHQYSMPEGKLLDSFRATLIGRSQELPRLDVLGRLSDIFHPDSGRNTGEFARPSTGISTEDFPPRDARLLIVSANARRAAWAANQATDGLADGSVTIADLVTRQAITKLRSYVENYPTTGMFDSSTQRLAIGSSSEGFGIVRVFDVSSGKLLFQDFEPNSFVLHVAISADGERVAAAFDNDCIKWWPVGADGSHFRDPRGFRPPLEASEESRKMFDELVAGVAEGNLQRIGAARDWWWISRNTEPLDFLELCLRHADLAVRREAIQILGTPVSGRRATLSESMLNRLLKVVEDDREDLSIRREVVRMLIEVYVHSRPKVFKMLAGMKEAGQFALPTIIDSLSDLKATNGSLTDNPPVGAAELLGSWGPDAADAIPTLIVALEHPNQWSFTPAVANALGAMGKAAQSAIPALEKASKSNYSGMRRAAQEALDRISEADGN